MDTGQNQNWTSRSLPFMLVAWIGISGCQRGPEPPAMVMVTGYVEMAGEPVTAGAIYFHPDESNVYLEDKPSSLLQLDGSFTIKTYPFGDGVPPGAYKVTLSPELATRLKKPKYGNANETPWSIDVPESDLSNQTFVVE